MRASPPDASDPLIPSFGSPSLRRAGGHRLLVVLHGYGDEPQSVFAAVTALDEAEEFTVVAPLGPAETSSGPAWFHVGSQETDGVSLLGTLKALDDLVAEESAVLAAEPADAVILGYSQGAAVALALGLRRGAPRRYRALGALAGHLLDADGLEWELSDAVLATEILLVHGADDEVVPVMLGRGAKRALEGAGVAVDWNELDTDHVLGPTLLSPVGPWLATLTN